MSKRMPPVFRRNFGDVSWAVFSICCATLYTFSESWAETAAAPQSPSDKKENPVDFTFTSSAAASYEQKKRQRRRVVVNFI